MIEQSTSLFSQLSQKDRVGVLKKLRLGEYLKLRRTCKWINSLDRGLFLTHSDDRLSIDIDATQNTLSITNDKADVFETLFTVCPPLNCELLSLNIGVEAERLFSTVEPKCSFKYIKVDKCTVSFVSHLPQKCRAFVTQLMTSLLPDYSLLTRFEYARIHKYSQSVTKDDNLEPFLKKLIEEGPGHLRHFLIPNVSKGVYLQNLKLDFNYLYDLDFDGFDNGRPVIKKCSLFYLEIALNRVLFITVMSSYLEFHVINNDLLAILETLLERLQLFRFKSCNLKYSPYDLGPFFDEFSISEKSDYSTVVAKFLELYQTHWVTPRK